MQDLIKNGLSSSRCCHHSLFWAAKELPRIDRVMNFTLWQQRTEMCYLFTFFLGSLLFVTFIHELIILSKWDYLRVERAAGSGISPLWCSLVGLCSGKNMVWEVLPVRSAVTCSFHIFQFVISSTTENKNKWTETFYAGFQGHFQDVYLASTFIRSQLSSFHFVPLKNHPLRGFWGGAGLFPLLFIYMFVSGKSVLLLNETYHVLLR